MPWARAGLGAVATQAIAEVAYGPRALALLQDGLDPGAALARLVAEDPGAAHRQVAVLDARGRVASHTGNGCIPFAGHAIGEQVSCQANMMASERVWPAMLEAYRSAEGPLSSRLLAALEAAEREGGDIRGRQSAAILIVPPMGEDWQTVLSLRVEDDREPLHELRRLLQLQDAYAVAEQADELSGEGRHPEAARLYQQASELAPDNHELRFWAGLGIALAGDLEAGIANVREAIRQQPGWRELLPRIPPELAPAAAEVMAALRVGERPSTDREFAIDGVGEGPGDSVADIPERELLDGFGDDALG